MYTVSITRAKTYFNSLTHLKVNHKPKSVCVCACVCVCVSVCLSVCFYVVYNLYCNFWTIGFIFMECGTDFNPYALLLKIHNR